MTREEAIDELQDLRNEVYNEDSDGYIYAKAIDMAIEALQDDWIPVSERLPECDDEVLVTLWWGYGKPEVWIIDYAEVKRGAKHGQSKDEKILAHITAWQPLPEPYKGGDTECT